MAEFRLETERLIMRDWRSDDLDAFHAINSDPKVRETLGPIMTRDAVADLIVRMQNLQQKDGCCFWALERKSDNRLIGWCGLIRGAHAPITDKLEIGWRLASDTWGHGYITEAAKKCIQWASAQYPDEDIWAITSETNRRSRAVMERLEMKYLPELDFDHPSVEPESDLLRHVTYCTERNQ
ncbi:GNAT family N-acetyltransferase [Parasphingorhabdus sp.]|uniref:GNAT family N-acetyltransferase n=1 Tax=Parasphingorhabdus sp. TaxID=2709688 RepID=UPI003263A361